MGIKGIRIRQISETKWEAHFEGFPLDKGSGCSAEEAIGRAIVLYHEAHGVQIEVVK